MLNDDAIPIDIDEDVVTEEVSYDDITVPYAFTPLEMVGLLMEAGMGKSVENFLKVWDGPKLQGMV